MPVVVAAGNQCNNSCNYSPAGTSVAITVGATKSTDGLYVFTNIGPCVDLFAPGSFVKAAGHLCNNCTIVLSGTSMAAPLVAGLAAIHLQKMPLLSPGDVLQRLINDSVRDVINFDAKNHLRELVNATPNILAQIPGEGDQSTHGVHSVYSVTFSRPH